MQPLVHLLIPVAALLLLRVDRRTVFLLSPLALLPDFDVFFSLHRGLFHNLFFGLFVAAAVYLLAGKTRTVLLAASFLFASHLALDFGYYGSAYFYPFDTTVYGFDFRTLSWISHSLAEMQVPHIFVKVPPALFAFSIITCSGIFLYGLNEAGLLAHPFLIYRRFANLFK